MTRIIQLSLIAFLLSSTSVFANAPKTIVLNDGSMIKGNITKMENGVYTIVSDQLGEIDIKETDIVTIQTSNSQVPLSNQQTGFYPQGGSNLQNQVEALQGTIMSDPDMMKDILKLMEDPEVQALITDKAFVNDVMSMDQNKLQNNTKVDQLMDNPKIKELMEKIQARYTANPTGN